MSKHQTVRIDLRIPNAGSIENGIEVEPLDNDLYRIAQVPSMFLGTAEHFEYQDVVKIERCPDGAHEFRSIVQPGRWRRFDFFVTREQVASDALAFALSCVTEMGGTWVRDAGGCLSILLPPDSDWDPTDAITNGEDEDD